MLTRRTLFKTAAAMGAIVACPMSNFSGRASATVDSQNAGNDSSERHNVLEVIAALEAREDLQDDLDIIELISRYTHLAEIPDDAPYLYGTCPLCRSKVYSLHVCKETQSFHCVYCFTTGFADTFYAHVEGTSLAESLKRLRHLLDRGDLAGHRAQFKELEAIYCVHAEVCHANLLCKDSQHPAWQWFTAQGITRETVCRLQMGLSPASGLRSLHDMLMGKGGFDYVYGVTGWPEDTLLVPMRDDQGHVLALMALDTRSRPDLPVSCYSLTDMRRMSPRRWMRMVFQAANVWQVADSHAMTIENEFVLLTDHVWDAIQLWQSGIPRVLAPGIDEGWANTRQLRSAVKLGRLLIYAASLRDICSTRFENLINHLTTASGCLEVAVLPDGYTTTGFVHAHGAKAFSALLENAVPVINMLRT